MALKYEGFSVQTAATAKQARHAVMDFRPDLMILDVGLPDDDGFTLVQRMITDGIKVPVIFLTARDATEEKVHGLTIGGDDYVTKPFSIEELVARIRVVLRRHNPDGAAATGKLVLHDLELDDETHEVFRARRAGRVDAHGVPPAALPDDEHAAACSRGRRSSTTSGTTTSAAMPACWRRTSATSAGRSTRSSPRSSTRFAGSDT